MLRLTMLALVGLLAAAQGTEATPADEVRAVVERFVAAQNAHDLTAVADLLWDSPEFLWITRGVAVWGRPSALTRFEALYRGTWRLEPSMAELRVSLHGDGVARVFVPIVFTIGAPGQDAQTSRFLMNQVLLKTPAGWKVTSILPILATTP